MVKVSMVNLDLYVSGRGAQLIGSTLYYISFELNLLVYDLDIVIQKKGKKVMPVMAASVAEDFSVVVENDMESADKTLWVLLKNGQISVQKYKKKGEVDKYEFKLTEIDHGETLVYNTIEATQDFAIVSAASNHSMKNFYYLVKPDQARHAQPPSLEAIRGKKRIPP
jgi:ABC-type microcin C transport system permease subunit YejE